MVQKQDSRVEQNSLVLKIFIPVPMYNSDLKFLLSYKMYLQNFISYLKKLEASVHSMCEMFSHLGNPAFERDKDYIFFWLSNKSMIWFCPWSIVSWHPKWCVIFPKRGCPISGWSNREQSTQPLGKWFWFFSKQWKKLQR